MREEGPSPFSSRGWSDRDSFSWAFLRVRGRWLSIEWTNRKNNSDGKKDIILSDQFRHSRALFDILWFEPEVVREAMEGEKGCKKTKKRKAASQEVEGADGHEP